VNPINDFKLFDLIKSKLYTSVVGDIMDKMGLYYQFLPAQILPIRNDMILVGRAMPVLLRDIDPDYEDGFGVLTRALDQLLPGEIYIAATEGKNYAAWGELLTATAKKRGALGAVINGYHRDTPQILEQNWPVFSYGGYAQDMSVRGAVIEFRCTVHIENVEVNPGDIVFGDRDGVVIIPHGIEGKVLQKAIEKADGEKTVRWEIENGMSSTEAFKKYGIL